MLLIFTDIFYYKYAWIICLKEKKGVSITNEFSKILNKFRRTPSRHKPIRKAIFTKD